MKTGAFKILALIVLVAVQGCKKDESKDTSTDKTVLITSSTWKYSNAGIDQNNDGIAESGLPPGTLATCDTDNTLLFKSDNTGVVDEGATKCDVADPQSIPFNWNFTSNGANINFSTAIIAGISGEARVVELTSTKLTMSKEISVPNSPIPVTVRVIVFLVH